MRGSTLIELVATIVIISIAVVVLMLLVSQSTGRSVDPMIQQQAAAAAQAYLEEIQQKRFCDPDWDPDGNPATVTDCPAACVSSACNSCRGVGAGWLTEARTTFDDVCDYSGLVDTGVRNQNGQLISGLDQYTVNIAVSDDAAVVMGPAGSQLTGTNGGVVRIDITVSHPAMPDPVRLSGHKANF